MKEFLENGENNAERGSVTDLYQREEISEDLETNQNAHPTW